MSDFIAICGRLAAIVPSIGGGRDNCGSGMIDFCFWCVETYDIPRDTTLSIGQDYVQSAVLRSMAPEEIREAYARWRVEVEE